jgi:hypothetical protein
MEGCRFVDVPRTRAVRRGFVVNKVALRQGSKLIEIIRKNYFSS